VIGQSWSFAILASCALLSPAIAADWGPHGHSEITYDAAVGDTFGLPSDISKVMSLGSIAPDYFEFDVPAAHAQVADPKIENQHLKVSEPEYRDRQRTAFVDSYNWHQFYFNAAVSAMQHGQRERAAFLLGYAIHNTEDLGTHQGMPNLVHASLDAADTSPDVSRTRLALSHAGASLDIGTFRKQIGEDNWRLFQGQAVLHGTQTLVPEPIHTLGSNLEAWNPRSGILPPSSDTSVLTGLTERMFQDAFKRVASEFGYAVEISGQLDTRPIAQIYNLLGGLHARQYEMFALLQVSHLGIQRRTCDRAEFGSCDPKAPDIKDDRLLAQFVRDALDYQFREPGRFAMLSADDRALLESTNWLDLAGQHQRMLIDRKLELENTLMNEYTDRINTLKQIIENRKLTLQRLAIWRKRLQDIHADWDRRGQQISNIRRPTIDARPPPPPPPSPPPSSSYYSPPSGPSYNENRPSNYERSNSDERSSGGISFSSPTYDFGGSGRLRFD
jgi:hypothetical protein